MACRASSGTSPQQRLADEKIRRVNALLAQSRKELRLKNAQMEDDLKMAREIQLTMLPQQYPTFPHSALPTESAFQFTHRYLPAGTVGGDFFAVSALSERRSRRVHLRCGRARRPLGAGDGHDPRAGGGAQAAGHESRAVSQQAQLRPARHPETHRHTDAHHGVLPGGGLEDRRDALRQRRPSQTAAYSPPAPTRSSRWPMRPAKASRSWACSRTRPTRPPR